MSSAYRSAYDHIVGQKLEDTREARARLVPLMPGLRSIARARMARIAAGGVGVAGAVLMVLAAATTRDETAALTLLGAVGALAGTWVVTASSLGIGGRLFPRPADEEPALSGQLDADVASIEASDPRTELARIEARAKRLELPSIVMPLAAISLLVPLFLHWIFTQLFTSGATLREFSEWIRISLVVVGHAHIALVVVCVLFARKIRAMDLETLAAMRIHREWSKAWLITIGVSCLPGILLFLVPPLLVAATALAFVPFMFVLMRRSVIGERLKLYNAAPPALEVEAVEGATTEAVQTQGAQVRVEQPLTEEEQREADRYYEDARADSYDRAQG